MPPNSLFAVLLRSPWWISFALVGLIALVAFALLPAQYAVVGALGSLPIFVVGCMAAWRQLRAPSPARVAETLGAVQAMPWRGFADALAQAWQQGGFDVQRLEGGAADFSLARNGSTTLASARRWKAATHGMEPLRELHTAMEQRGATAGIYVLAQGSLSENARLFARDHGITIVQDTALAALLLAKPAR